MNDTILSAAPSTTLNNHRVWNMTRYDPNCNLCVRRAGDAPGTWCMFYSRNKRRELPTTERFWMIRLLFTEKSNFLWREFLNYFLSLIKQSSVSWKSAGAMCRYWDVTPFAHLPLTQQWGSTAGGVIFLILARNFFFPLTVSPSEENLFRKVETAGHTPISDSKICKSEWRGLIFSLS